jgi:hypothetical protein
MSSLVSLLVGIIMLVAATVAGEHFGHTRGVNEQKVEDQVVFDNYHNAVEEQKSQASALLVKVQATIIAEQEAGAAFKNQLEIDRAKNRDDVDALRRKYADSKLRFIAPATGQTSGCGGGSGGSAGTEGKASGPDAPTVVQLPDSIAGNLRQLTLDADKLSGEYATCYRYVNR